MPDFAATFRTSLEELVRVAASTSAVSAGARTFADTDLMSAQRAMAEVKRHVDACAAVLAGETVRRSSVEAGLGGIARKHGFRTPEALVRVMTGSTSREAATLVRVGSMLNDAEVLAAASAAGGPDAAADSAGTFGSVKEPWLAAVGAAVAAGTLSIAGAEAISTGLGRPGPGVSVESLGAVAERLVASIAGQSTIDQATIDADRILRLARNARDELDAEGIVERERQRRSMRSFRRWRRPDGMTGYTWLLEPESAALVDDIYDKITSPRRGGPRFVADADRAHADAIERDQRTTDQLASDGFLELLQLAINTDPTSIVGVQQPAVRVLVSAKDLARRSGRGWIEGQPDPVSIATVERYVCRGGIDTIVFDGELQPANLGRTQRVFNRTQRRLLSARDGGCRWPGCERPPEWTEAHHIRWWDRDGGRTDVDNGILLCRHHHLLLHDNGWQIETTTRVGPNVDVQNVGKSNAGAHNPLGNHGGETEYWLVPPPNVDPAQTRRPMPSKSRALEDALRVRAPVPA